MKAFHVSENSWHYKLHNIVRDPLDFIDPTVGSGWFKYDSVILRKPKNLCNYFWSTILAALATAVGLVIALAIGLAVLVTSPAWGAVVLVVWGTRKFFRWNRHMILLKRSEEYKTFVSEHGVQAWEDKKNQEKRPGMILSFLKAKKAKACPLIVIDKVDSVN